LIRFSKVKKSASILLPSLADSGGRRTDPEYESATEEMRPHPYQGMSRKIHKCEPLFCFQDALFTGLPRRSVLGNPYADNCIDGSKSARIGVVSAPSYGRGDPRYWGAA
jgi:hypothetical protein